MSKHLLRNLPSIDRLLGLPPARRLIEQFGRPLATEALRAALDETRQQVLDGSQAAIPAAERVVEHAHGTLEAWTTPTLRRVINATGVIVHTNLGRAPLPDAALDALAEVGGGYSTLEFDLDSGTRGSRSVHAETLLKRVCGAEAALVVNNNAAAVLLTLTALAGRTRDNPDGRGVIVSRGQLVEIGGGFRMPDVMAESGARLVEVGTTNRTHLRDYEQAIDESAALILRAHRSNFDIIGFTTEPALEELASTAHQHGLLCVDDIGSGALFDTAQFGLRPEPTVQASLAAGADVVMFSGDKLLGGPQAGILVGKAEVISTLRQHPLARAIRPDKLCLAALSATLLHYLKGEALDKVPVWQMISTPVNSLDARAQRWAKALAQTGLSCEVIDGQSVVGGGSLPGETLPSRLVSIRVPSPDAAARHLRGCQPPVIVRREDDRLVADPRTVLDRDEQELLAALKTLAAASYAFP
jgi:L-seryl-tRNA(Ser) seleniumtransferase